MTEQNIIYSLKIDLDDMLWNTCVSVTFPKKTSNSHVVTIANKINFLKHHLLPIYNFNLLLSLLQSRSNISIEYLETKQKNKIKLSYNPTIIVIITAHMKYIL